MRMLLLYILLVAFGCQQTPFLESENLKTSESEKGCELRAMSNESFLESENLKTSESEKGCEQRAMSNEQKSPNAQGSQHEAQSLKKTVDCCPLTVDYYENQIRLADSLYKNYLPQYNFEEVKAAVMFFDSCEQRAMSNEPFSETEKSVNISEICGNEKTNHKLVQKKSEKGSEPRAISNEQRFRKAQSSQLEAQSLKKTVDCCPLTVDIEYQRALAHYYHAVGLTERDDIVGACEHYFIALEIMESETENLKTSKSGKGSEQRAMSHEQKFRNAHRSKLEAQSPDYKKIRFIALIYTRLGRLFYNENYCDLAMLKYKKALKYYNIINDTISESYTYKNIGNVYQLLGKADSALYHYKKSLEIYSGPTNKLDIEKSIAQILFYEGERDSAYVILKNNLREIDNGNLKYSYHYTLGDMYYSDRKYDSALYYLETSLDNDIVTKKVAFTTKLSAIYDSLGDYDKRDYYDNFSVKMFLNHANKEVDNKQLQVLYDNYKERKNEREKSIAKVRTRKLIIAISLGVFVILVSFTIFLKYRNKRHIDKLTEKIDDYANENKQLAEDFQKASSKKDKIIKQQKKEIEEIKNELSKKNRVDLDAYYDSDICKKITARKDSDFSCLKEDELALLMKSADAHLNNISTRLYEQFPTLNTNDIYTICLIILNIEKNKFPYLLSRDRKTIYDRFSKIRKLMNIDTKQDLFIHIKDNYLR